MAAKKFGSKETQAQVGKLLAAMPMPSDAEPLSDEELLSKLRSFGIHLDRPSLERLCEESLSPDEIVGPMIDRLSKSEQENPQIDWIWICVAALWERWFPDKPSCHVMDAKMQAGYDLLDAGGTAGACRVWLDTWSLVTRLLDKAGIRSIEELDDRYRGLQSVFNWMQDLETALWNAGLDDPKFLSARISVCEEALTRFRYEDEHDLTTENRRRALAEAYFTLGQTEKAEALFREWLRNDPCWGWGWIGWSDCYHFAREPQSRIWEKSEQILKQGLSIDGVRDRLDVMERLAHVCDELGRREEADELRRQLKASVDAQRSRLPKGSGGGLLPDQILLGAEHGAMPARKPQSLTADRRHIGRKEPCPCGSGKKFKRCCGHGQ